jgi:CAAX prenyl protease-like protein
VAVVPFAEELAFRGYLTRRFSAADVETVPAGRFSWIGFIVSSVLFGTLHSSWIAGILVGMVYAWAWYRRGSIGDAVLAHAVTNFLLAVMVLAGGQWQLWV